MLTYLLISIGPLMLCAIIIYFYLSNNFNNKSINEYLSKASIYATQITEDYFQKKSERANVNQKLDTRNDQDSFRLLIFDNRITVLYDSNNSETGKTLLVSEVMMALKGKPVAHVYKNEQSVYASAMIKGKKTNDSVIGSVLVVGSVSENYLVLKDISRTLIILIGIVVFFVTLLVFFNSKIILEPLQKFLKGVERISEGRLDERIDQKGNDEFAVLAVAFNNMTNQLQKVEKTREEFVSNVSHELKTPLSSIKILSDAILTQEKVDVSVYKEFLQDINSEIDRMTNIINDLLNVVKLDQGEVGLNIKSFELNKMIEDILKRLYPIAEQKSISIRFNDNNKKIIVEADEVKMTLAISNLIDNAIKYTENEGSIKISIDCDHMHSFISVQDSGIGISEEEQSKVFKRFYRVDKTRDRETGGTGLGLAITHATVLLHNGSIKISSKEGEGSTFLVRIPLQCSASKTQ